MELITIFIISLGLSMDCFGVAIINGLDPRSVQPGTKLKVALSFALAHYIMIYAGYYLGSTAKSIFNNIHHWIAFAILAFMGTKMIISNLSINVISKALNINSIKVIIGLSVATSIDALIAGTSLPFLHYRVGVTALIVAIVVLLITFTGIHAGKQFGLLMGKRAGIIGGILIIGVGIANILPYIF